MDLTTTIKRIGQGAVAAAGIGAAAYFLDPDSGRRRRAIARDRIAAFCRGGYRDATGVAQTAAIRARNSARGVLHGVRHATQSERPAPNDAELAHRVSTEIFRAREAPKGSVNVNAERGIVYLRGKVESEEQIQSLVAAARGVDGVRGVENLLHLPGEPAARTVETEEETRLRVEASRSG